MDRNGERLTQERLAREYGDALREYLGGGGEAALTRAYELGRRAAASGLGILELAAVHHEAFAAAPPGTASAGMAAQFLAESLSPFEMTLRSFQANARLLGLSETLVQQNAEIDRSREQLRTILDATTAVIYLKDADGRYVFVNRRFQEVFGLDREQVAGRRDEEILPPSIARTLAGDDQRALAACAPQEVEETLPASDGAHTWLASKFPLLGADGECHGLCSVATDITQRKRADEALLREKESALREKQLQHALEVRDQFLQIASHELKTPLTSLELQVASLRRHARAHPATPISDEGVLSKCESIVRQADKLTVLINELIDVGRIASGDIGLTLERVDLRELVRAVLARWGEAIARSGSRVTLAAPAPVVGTWDRARLESVVANLLSNALKFGDGKPVEVAVEEAAGRAVLTVRDHGIGIGAEDQARIFERFERAVSVRHFGGFGIGLWVARRALESLGGTIGVRSRHQEGSEFVVDLPLVPEPRSTERTPHPGGPSPPRSMDTAE